tara:strand:- start:3302 stop:3889 length:588 start_codon:yes stop_codon:yes gene_type:complete
MDGYKDFIVSPIGERYNNVKRIDNKELILNTEIFNHQYINRLAKIISIPLLYKTPISVGDEVIIHHNVFRRWHDVKGREKNSRSYWKEDKYIISKDQIYLYKKASWSAMPGYSFVKPIVSNDKFVKETERSLIGIIKYNDGTFDIDTLVGFTPNSEYEFVINGERLYRVLNKFITIKYEYKGDEKEYNPSWAQSR